MPFRFATLNQLILAAGSNLAHGLTYYGAATSPDGTDPITGQTFGDWKCNSRSGGAFVYVVAVPDAAHITVAASADVDQTGGVYGDVFACLHHSFVR